MAEEEKGYEVVDKRRVKLDNEEAADEAAESPAEVEGTSAPEEEPKPEDKADGLPPVDVFSLLGSFITMLGMQAWQWMGLVKDPATGNIEKDLAQAKVAIDAIAALAGQPEGKISSADAEELRRMISDLRINFVRQS